MSEPLHIVCPHCHTTNRVRADDLDSAPDCGGCHRPLFTGAPLALDEAGFDRHIGRSQIPVLVDFWAPWCGPCRMLSPIVDEIADERGDIKVGKVNVDEQPELANNFGVMSIPTLLLMKNGKVVSQAVGARPKESVLSMIDA